MNRSPQHHSGRFRVTREAGRLCPSALKSHLNLQPLAFSALTETSPLSLPLSGDSIPSFSNVLSIPCLVTLVRCPIRQARISTWQPRVNVSVPPSPQHVLAHSTSSHTLRKHRQVDRLRCRARLRGASPDPWVGFSKQS